MQFLDIYKDNDVHIQVALYIKPAYQQYYFHSRSEHLYALKKSMAHHGTIIRAVIICKKIPCYMRDSA